MVPPSSPSFPILRQQVWPKIWSLVLVAVLAQVALGKEPAVWQLGTFDYSSEEFGKKDQKSEVVFHPSESAVVDWPSFQAVAGTATPSRKVQFTVDKVAAGYRLRAAVIIDRPSVPALKLEINGHAGLFYLHPTLDYHNGDLAGGSRAGYSHALLEIDVPAPFLQAGENTMVVQPVATSGESVPEAGLYWDALELVAAEGAVDKKKLAVSIEPTIFFHQEAGGLAEEVDVFVHSSGKMPAGQMDLELAGKHYQQPLKGGADFGEEKLEFKVPEFEGKVPARATLTVDGSTTNFEQTVAAKKKWTIYIVPHIHLDLSYTDYFAKIATLHSRVLDEAIDLVEQHPDYRFSTDGQWVVNEFMSTRAASDQQRLIDAMKARKIFSPASEHSILTGFPTAETLIRSFYDAANFSRLHGVPFEYTTITDVPSYSWSYASILASAGLKYFVAGSDNIRGPVLVKGRLHEASPFWWVGPDGKKVLFWYAFVYRQVQMLFGLPPVAAAGRETLPIFLQSYERPDYTANATLLYGVYGENRDLEPSQAALAKLWNAAYAYPRLEYAGFPEAMAEIERQMGDQIPSMSGDGGPYWEDGIAGNPVNAAIERATERRAPSAEKIATISAVVNPRIAADKARLDEMWRNIINFDEHTGVPLMNIPEHDDSKTINWWETKRSFAENGRWLTNWILQNSMGTVTDSIGAPTSSLVVFNTLNWARSGRVTYDLQEGYGIVDATTTKRVPFRIVGEGDGFHRVEFEATDVPGIGYKVYLLRRAMSKKTEEPEGSVAKADPILENGFYKVEIDPASGAVKSIFDKELKRELVDQKSPYRFGQFLYVTGGDGTPTTIVQYSATHPAPEYTIKGAGGGRLISMEQTPEGPCAKVESSLPDYPKISTEIRLSNTRKQIEFVTEIERKQVFRRESAYLAWPFAMAHPQFQYEIQNGVVDPAVNMLPGAGLEWFSVQHWASVQQDGVSGTVMPLDNPLITLGDISRRLWLTKFGERPGSIFSLIYTNYHQPAVPLIDWKIGDRFDTLRFRHIVTSAPSTDPAELSRRGWEEATPLEVNEVMLRDKSWPRPALLDGKQGVFATVNDPALLLQTWKPAEDGDGTILRFLDLGGAARKVAIGMPLLNLASVQQTDAVERGAKALALSGPHAFQIDVQPHEIVTVRVKGTPVLKAPVIPADASSSGKKPYSDF